VTPSLRARSANLLFQAECAKPPARRLPPLQRRKALPEHGVKVAVAGPASGAFVQVLLQPAKLLRLEVAGDCQRTKLLE